MVYVYALHLADGEFRYIGVSANPARRLREHKNESLRGGTYPKNYWIRKHFDDIQMTILVEFDTREEANKAEVFYISKYREKGDLLNMTDGGDGSSGHMHTEETKQKMSEARLGNTNCLGNILSDEHKRKISEAELGRSFTDEHKQKIAVALSGNTNSLGHMHTEESRQKMSAALLGKTFSEEAKKNMSEAKLGKPNFGMHVRWHVNRGTENPECFFCLADNIDIA